jgi:S-DNA-T family DNA segregation ATPase FtsK/SpoIIIE
VVEADAWDAGAVEAEEAVGAEEAFEADDALPEVGGIPIQLPSYELLDPPLRSDEDPVSQAREVRERVSRIDETLANFKLQGRVVSSVRGPTVTRFEVEPAPGEKISRFAGLSDDLALAMAVGSVRIEAPIPGKSVIGLEVPNASRDLIRFREAAEAGSFKRTKARLPLILGKSIDGEMVVGDLARMPHLLIAGSTGSGKSVAVNTLIGSLLYKFLPTELRFLMIDPKMVELTPFDGIPHLLRPVVTNPGDAAGVLLGAVAHMERRYKMMSKIGAKNLDQYNEKARNLELPELPFIVIVIDELADLMITSPKEVESAIMRLAQMARATGMHLILATQRPSVDILTSLIKVNVPARIAFAVSSGHDSRTILDTMGAERLIGSGDMLFYQPGLVKPMRLQGPFISEAEIYSLASFLRRQYFDDDFVEAYGADFDPPPLDDSSASGMVDWNDDKLREAAELVVNEGQASVSRLQRRLGVGHARAGKLMDSLEALGVVGPHLGSKPREVLVTLDELPNVFGR